MKQAEVRKQWEGAASGWAKWESKLSEMVEPATWAMLEMAGVCTDARVLDLACGAGSQTLEAARLVGPGGQVLASDLSANMLQYVGKKAEEAQLKNVSTLQAAAEELDLPASSVDAVICRLGLMLFSDPGRALRSVLPVLKPGGRLAAVVFTTPQANPFMAKPMQVLLRHAGQKPPAPGEPGIFSLGAPGQIEQLLNSNGYDNIGIKTFSHSLKLNTVAEALVMMKEAFGAYRAVLAGSPESVRVAAWAEVEEVLRDFETGQGFEAPLEVLVAAGSKPA